MLGILSLISGFVSPWIGDLFGLLKARQQNAHELLMLKESNKSAREIADLNAQVGMAQAEVDDVRSARSTQQSYGVKLLDAVAKEDGWFMRSVIKPFLIVMLILIEIANGFMRPYAIYTIMTLWASTKVARFYLGYHAIIGAGGTEEEMVKALAGAVIAIWDDHDWAALDYVLGFLLGSRHKLKENGQK